MVIENVIQIGNSILNKKSKKVEKINSLEIKKIIEDLTDTMRHLDCVGMAAQQIEKNLRIFVSEIRKTPYRDEKTTDKLRVFINPKIIWASKKQKIIFEGCASVIHSNFFGPVKRPEKIIIAATNENGKKFKLKADGLLARVIQHEYDHLNGINFVEKISDLRKVMSKEEYFKSLDQDK